MNYYNVTEGLQIKMTPRDLSTFKRMYNRLSTQEKSKTNAKAWRMYIAYEIKSMRTTERQMTIKELAKKSGVSRKTISKIEHAKPVNIDSLFAIIDALECELKIEVRL
ncbi:helix-turn-helix domain-containing protein [Candidatus Dojkabacteria bacterium]|nr:helix-turn-helix domain-containing protein [Candidatus Dojkabacteria bacterium]